MTLRGRKRLYAVFAIVSTAIWMPIMALGIVYFGIGAVGLLCVGALIRCIFALPVQDRFSRIYYSVAITTGVLLLAGFLALIVSDGLPSGAGWWLICSGVVLLIVGVAVLKELYQGARASRPLCSSTEQVRGEFRDPSR